ncbi:MAG TPA: translation initiation factor 2 subunit beta, partial [Thermoprotei archaeon]|nr:translation initiation factor 2 subunit beta [Thermoprotei archaeon]
VLRYILKELAIPGSLEGSTAVLLGEKSKRAVQAVLNRFIKNYVYCPICGQPDTTLVKEKKMMFIICMACGAKSAVKSF